MKIYSYRTTALASLAVVVVWMGRQQGRFNREIASLESQLLHKSDEKQEQHPAQPQQQSWEDLPPVVQRYFHRVFTHRSVAMQETTKSPYTYPVVTTPAIQSLIFLQKGSFHLNGKWCPFVARQTVSAIPIPDQIGFVWQASISFLPSKSWWSMTEDVVKVRVCDALVHGRAYLTASLWGVFPLAHERSTSSVSSTDLEDTDGGGTSNSNSNSILQGQLLRWLAEAPLYPTILLPSEGLVTWTAVENEPNQAILEMHYPVSGTLIGSIDIRITVTFDPEQGWITQVECTRGRKMPSGKFAVMPWKGYLSHYQPVKVKQVQANNVTNMLHMWWVPTHMEGGWIVDGKEELYFKGANTDLDYDLRRSVVQEQVAEE
jgi:hypothetical protein